MTAQPLLAKVLIALGAAFMAGLALGTIFVPPHAFIGQNLYDIYAQALFNGRFDLPARELRLEGHYTPDGTGYLYHGLGPLLTRIPFAPFVDFPTGWLSGLSIWFWAVLGNAAWHRAFWLAFVEAGGEAIKSRRQVAIALAFAVWFAAPGLILTASGTLFNEAIAMAYALAGGFMLLIALMAFSRIAARRAVILLAILAGLMVHARPHLALGLYLGTGIVMAAYLREHGLAALGRLAAAAGILGAFGLLLIASNAARFDDAAKMHGSFEDRSLQYGMVYWGIEDPEGRRARTFEDHGRFNVLRIPGNLMIYLAQPPSEAGFDAGVRAVDRLHERMVAPAGFVRVEEAKVGTLWLWPLWMALMAVGLAQRRIWSMPALAGMAAAGAGALMMLSYGTVTLRYHVDLWPVIGFPAIFGIFALTKRAVQPAPARPGPRVATIMLAVLLLLGAGVTMHKTLHSRVTLMAPEGTAFGTWSSARCLRMIAPKKLGEQRSREVCGITEKESTT